MAIQEFEELRLDPKISFGFSGGPAFKTTITTNPGGYEIRNVDWSQFKAEYSADYDVKTQAELNLVRDFHISMRGRAVGFRFFDWLDYCTDQNGIIAQLQSGGSTPDPTTQIPSLPAAGVLTASVLDASATAAVQTYQLIKTYTVPSLAGDDYVRTIAKPVSSAHVRAYVDSVEDAGATVDTTTGIITLATVIAGGEVITADAIYDVPVRFQKDFMPPTLEHFDTGSIVGVDLTEIRL